MPASRSGPRTEAGKAVASRNALSHGITCTEPVIAGMERQADWRRHLHGILASLSPEGELEEALAERVASLLWRIRRVTRYEVAVTLRQVDGTEYDLAIAGAYGAGTIAKGVLPAVEPERVARAQETRILPDAGDLD